MTSEAKVTSFAAKGRFRSLTIAALNAPGNLADNQLSPGWTPGATIIDSLEAQPSLTRPWTIYGWSIKFQLWLFNTGELIRGRLGRLVGGLVRDPQTTRPGGTPWVNPVLPLPDDLSTISELWNGQADAAPPQFLTTSTNLPISPEIMVANQLPQPIILEAADRIGMGMWLMPSLIGPGTANLYVVNAGWSITYTT